MNSPNYYQKPSTHKYYSKILVDRRTSEYLINTKDLIKQ